MTNTMQQGAPAAAGTGTRRASRAITVAAGAAGALVLWAVADPCAGLDLAVHQGGGVQRIGPAAVAVTASIAGLAAWALLALLERAVRRPVRTYRAVASVVLLLSLVGPLGSGAGTGSRLVLAGMHLVVGAVLIGALPGRRTQG